MGGFINISQSAKQVIFVGTMTAGGLKVDTGDGKLQIVQEGRVKKAVDHVAQISFSGRYALRKGQRVLYVTERAVFELTENGVMLKETAPGVCLERDVLQQMEFTPLQRAQRTFMAADLFRPGRMGLTIH